jgi:hypothetical protein
MAENPRRNFHAAHSEAVEGRHRAALALRKVDFLRMMEEDSVAVKP